MNWVRIALLAGAATAIAAPSFWAGVRFEHRNEASQRAALAERLRECENNATEAAAAALKSQETLNNRIERLQAIDEQNQNRIMAALASLEVNETSCPITAADRDWMRNAAGRLRSARGGGSAGEDSD